MKDFFRLYLRGDLARKWKQYLALYQACILLETLCAMLPLVLSLCSVEVPRAAEWGLTGAGAAFGVLTLIFAFRRPRVAATLVGEQNAVYETLCTGEERERYARLYRAYCETQVKTFFMRLGECADVFATIFMLILLSILSLVPNGESGGEMNGIIVGAVVGVGGALILVSLLFSVYALNRREREFYDKVGGDLDALKLQFGFPRRESGRSGLPTAVRLFVKDEVDRRELVRRSERSAIALIIFLVGAFACMFLASLVEQAWEMYFGMAWGIAFFCALVGFAVANSLKQREIYRRNRVKLTDSEIDRARGALQTAWESNQRRGNLIFLCFLLAGFVVGATLGGVSLAGGGGIGGFFGCVGGCVFAMAILSFVAWAIFYMATNSKLKGLQDEIVRLRDSERREERK